MVDWNAVSLVAGIVIIFFGIIGVTVTIPFEDSYIFLTPLFISIIGAFFALMGGAKRWS